MNRLMWWSWGAIAGLAAVLAIAAWVAWPGPAPGEPPRAREYRDFDVCLLTDERGVNVEPAATAWAALQEINVATRVRVTHYPVTGEQTVQRAKQFVATMSQQRCAVAVAIGQNQVEAVNGDSGAYPTVKFVTLADTVTKAEVTQKVSPLIPAE